MFTKPTEGPTYTDWQKLGLCHKLEGGQWTGLQPAK